MFDASDICLIMEDVVLRNLEPKSDPGEQQQSLAYLEEVKNCQMGWAFAMNYLINAEPPQDDRLTFFSCQVLEHYVKNYYNNEVVTEKDQLREFLGFWVQIQCTKPRILESSYLRNKAAQIFALVFVHDYPTHWPDFFDAMFQLLRSGRHIAFDMYLRILKSIDSEIADRDIVRTQQEAERCAVIKDAMRASCVSSIAESWYFILEKSSSFPDLVNSCLETVGAYIAWIDISLVANDRFIRMVLSTMEGLDTREAAADCLRDIISKGMEPMDKLQLTESLVQVLKSKGYLIPIKDDMTDFTTKMAKLVNAIGINLIEAKKKIEKSVPQNNLLFTQAINQKIPVLLEFLSNDYDDVSVEVLEFAKDYIHVLKNGSVLSQEQVEFASSMLIAVINKMKYDDSYNFAQEGEDEATFQEFRKQLKVIFDNLAGLDKEMVIDYVTEMTTTMLKNWQNFPFQDVELAIHVLYLVGEAIPVSGGNHFTGEQTKISASLVLMMGTLVTSGVCEHQHPAVGLEFLETVARYDKYFQVEPDHIPNVLMGFLDHRGIRNENPVIRSRSAYLFSRFVKSLRSLLQPYVKILLEPLQYLLILVPPTIKKTQNVLISQDDQLYLYEAAAVLIVSEAFTPQEKGAFMSNMVRPILEGFKVLMLQLVAERNLQKQELLASSLCHAMAVTTRASKAFNNHQTMKSWSCVPVFIEATKVFLECLQIPKQTSVLRAGVRQFLHRMVMCLEEELLTYIPQASEGLLKGNDIHSIQEYIPLIIQIIGKFKLSWLFQKEVVPFLQQMFMPVVNAIFTALSMPLEDNDMQGKREKQLLQRNYFQFVTSIVTNNVIEVLSAQESSFLEQVMMSIIRGAVDFPDPISQKMCFSILRKLVDLWGGKEHPVGFDDFIYKNIVPACFMAPMKPTFDLNDAQTILALHESAMCMKTIYQRLDNKFITYLDTEYLPTLQLSAEMISNYCHAIKCDNKMFKNFIVKFFEEART